MSRIAITAPVYLAQKLISGVGFKILQVLKVFLIPGSGIRFLTSSFLLAHFARQILHLLGSIFAAVIRLFFNQFLSWDSVK